MLKIYLRLVPFLCFLTFQSFSQSQRELVDSLKIALDQSKNPNDQATILSELVWNFVPISMDSAIIYGEKGVEVALPLNDPVLLSQLYSDLGYAWMEKGELINARENYQAALEIRYGLGDSVKIYGTLTNLGSVYQRDFQSDSAMVNYLKALSFFEKTGNDRYVDFIRNNIGVIYLEMRNYSKALEILNQVADYRKSQEDYYGLAMVYTNLGNTYKNLGGYENAERVYLEALDIFSEFEDIYNSATTLNNLATLNNTQKNTLLAIEYANKGLELADQAGASYDYALLESNLAQSYNDLKDYSKSREYYLRALRHFEDQNAEDDIASMFLLMSPVYAALDLPDSAAYYTSEYVELNRKLTEQGIQQLTSDLETRYQTEKKDAAIAMQELEIRNRTLQLVGSLSLAAILGIVGYLLYAQQKLKNGQLRQEVELKAALGQIETQNQLQEQRVLISRDLHDNIGAQLTFIISSIENLKYFDPIKEQLTDRYDTIANFTKQTITELRDTIWAMNSGQISWEQLSTRIIDYLHQIDTSGSKTNYSFSGAESLSADFRFTSANGIQIYRILQEAIQNAMKYGEATEVQVDLSKSSRDLHLRIFDNGKGFDKTKVTQGNGLFNMRKRAEELGGKLEIISEIDVGTTISLIWPISSSA